MSTNGLPQGWADQFGLALAPLFGTTEMVAEGSHAVLLDGGYGSFAMSETDEELWRDEKTSCWAWSSDLPHHVTVTDNVVAVTRWDSSEADVFSRFSVEEKIETFYSYLATDRVQSTRRVVDYVLYLFRRMRSLVADAALPDEQSTDAFLAFLTEIIERDRPEVNSRHRRAILNTQAGSELLSKLSENGVDSLIEELREPTSLRPFRLFPSLAVRHAGSEVFQEAHFELLRAPSLDLFSYAGPAEAKSVTRGGAHFTPAALARCVVDQTLRQVENLATRKRLTVLDPACGSGSFLHEALRALRRLAFAGQIVLVGRDISPSAVSMADFVVRHSAADGAPESDIKIDIRVADSLTVPLPKADVVLMNPPFISWPLLNDLQRDQMQQVLGSNLQGRGDISMAFVSRAVDGLDAGGALGVLIPASLLTLQAAERWRANLLERTDLRMLSELGDYGLFAHALVQVAAAVMGKPTDLAARRGTTTALVTTNSAEATGEALRSLRRSDRRILGVGKDDAWRLFEVPTRTFQARRTWRLTTPRAEAALSKFLDAGAARISDLFDVRQGVHTGNNRAFVLGKSDYETLPKTERRFFIPAVMNQSIQDGQLRLRYWVFYPYDLRGQMFKTEDELMAAVPTYAERFLIPHREDLLARRSRARGGYTDWWGLSERRATWAFDSTPRLVSKYRGGPGGFTIDRVPKFLVVQGYVWFLKTGKPDDKTEEEASGMPIEDLLCAYLGIMNSRRFGSVMELFSPHVAGGQFDLSPRYVKHVPIPNLAALAGDERLGRLISRLVELGRESRVSERSWVESADRITTELYGGEFFDRV